MKLCDKDGNNYMHWVVWLTYYVSAKNMNYDIACLSNGWNYFNTCLNDVLT